MEPKRNEFRERMNQFKKAREANPQLSYWEWKNSLPDNLANTPDWQYNNIGAWTGGLEPEMHEDGYYHLGSRNPQTGEILKPKSHPTYQKALESDANAGYFPYEKNGRTYTKTYAPTGDLSGYADGTEGIKMTPEQEKKFLKDRQKYAAMSGAISPVLDIRTAADFTPIGNAIASKEIYDATSSGNYLDAGLIGASLVVPPVLAKPVKRYIPTVSRTVANKINKLLDNSNAVKESEWNNTVNRAIERIYDKDVRDRAALLKDKYGVDIQAQYDAIDDLYTNNYESIPKAKIMHMDDGARAKMHTNPTASKAWATEGKPAGMKDFEMRVRPDVEPSKEVAEHEINHWWTYSMMQNPDWRRSELQKITKDFEGALHKTNPLDPDNSEYYRDWMEQNAYGINVVNSMKELGIPFTKENVIKFINQKPDTSAQKRAARQFKNMDLYFDWLRTMPLAGMAGAAYMLYNEEE